MADLFFPQSVLDEWSAQEKIQLSEKSLVLSGRTYGLVGAVHVLRCVSEDHDPNDLVDRVKKIDELLADGADAMAKSLIYKEQAYEVDPGFIGHVAESAVKPEAVAQAARARAVRMTMSMQAPTDDDVAGARRTQEREAARIASEHLAKKAGAGATGAGGKKGGAKVAAAAAAPAVGPPPDGSFTDEELLTNFLLENL